MTKDLPTPDTLRKLLRYEPETGKLFWRERSEKWFNDGKQTSAHKCAIWNARYANKEAFTGGNGGGYKHGHVLSAQCVAHRVIWAIHYGFWPIGCIDHINGVKIDNRIENLRDVSKSGNARNALKRFDNTSGVCGVYWSKPRKKWRARITVNGKTFRLGDFDNIEAAASARRTAEIEHGFTERHGT